MTTDELDFNISTVYPEELENWDIAPLRMSLSTPHGEWPSDDMVTLLAYTTFMTMNDDPSTDTSKAACPRCHKVYTLRRDMKIRRHACHS